MVETEIDAPEKAKSWKNRDDSAKSGGASDEAEVQGQESIPEWFRTRPGAVMHRWLP